MVPHRGCRDDPKIAPRASGRHGAGGRRGPRIIGAMLLALDIGNTNVTLGLFRAGALLATRRAATDPRATTDEFELLLDGLLRLDGIAARRHRRRGAGVRRPEPDRRGGGLRRAARGGRCSSPAPAPSRSPSAWTGRARSGPTGWSTPWPPPGCTGRRRSWSTSAPPPRSTAWPATGRTSAARSRPGLELGLEALAARTAKLPRVELRAPDRAIGRDTVSAIQSGAVLGYQALVTGLLARIRRELADADGDRARGRSGRS